VIFDEIAESLLAYAQYIASLYDLEKPRRSREEACTVVLCYDEYHSQEEFAALFRRLGEETVGELSVYLAVCVLWSCRIFIAVVDTVSVRIHLTMYYLCCSSICANFPLLRGSDYNSCPSFSNHTYATTPPFSTQWRSLWPRAACSCTRGTSRSAALWPTK